MPRFSVIVATHRRPVLLARALDSLLAQSYPCHQILVISDVADEATWRVCSERLRAHDRFVERGGPSGPAPSRNLGIDLADGDYVLFLDDDDIFRPDFFAHLGARIARQSAPAIFYTNCEVIQGNDPAAEALAVDLSGFTVDTIFIKNFIPNNCLAFPRGALEGVRFDPEIAYEDWEFILSASRRVGLQHLPISGPVVFKNAVPGVAGRGVNNRPRVIDCYRRIYRKHPAPYPAIAEGRRQFVLASGIQLDEEGYPRAQSVLSDGVYEPVCLPNPEAPIRVGVHNYYESLTRDGYMLKHAGGQIGHMLFEPWNVLYRYGQSVGFEVYTLDQVAGPADLDAVIFLDRPAAGSVLANRFLEADLVKYLAIYECPVIKPDNWEESYHQQFDRVLTWSDPLVDGRRYLKNNFQFCPERYAFKLEEAEQSYFERKLVTLIAGAKSSSHPRELYSHRLRTIRWFEQEAPADFDLYGLGWDAGQFPSYRGAVDDKLATLAKYRFAICYENAQGYSGYITEKILDCFLAGCVPVYGGPPNASQWIPEDCFIPIGRFTTYAELHAHLREMDVRTYRGYLQRIAAFMRSAEAYPFTTRAMIETLVGALSNDVRRRRGEADLPEIRQAADGRLGLVTR